MPRIPRLVCSSGGGEMEALYAKIIRRNTPIPTEMGLIVGGYAMTTKITRDVLESYLRCKYKGHLKLAGEQGSKSDYEMLQEASRNQVRQAAETKLEVRYGGGVIRRGLT